MKKSEAIHRYAENVSKISVNLLKNHNQLCKNIPNFPKNNFPKTSKRHGCIDNLSIDKTGKCKIQMKKLKFSVTLFDFCYAGF